MELMDAIEARRSVRHYTDQPVAKETVETLIHAAAMAPSAMNGQPWVFAVIQDAALLTQYSDRAKERLLAMMDQRPEFGRYRQWFSDPNFHIFHNAGTLVIIMSRQAGAMSERDCCLAAENLMLAARDLGLGTCWIGFAGELFNQPEVKQELGIPAEYVVVAPLVVGYPQGFPAGPPRNEPEVLFWK